jgi:hypothetical protein
MSVIIYAAYMNRIVYFASVVNGKFYRNYSGAGVVCDLLQCYVDIAVGSEFELWDEPEMNEGWCRGSTRYVLSYR